MQSAGGAFDAYEFIHCALPEIDFDQISTETTFLGKPLKAPILISCMTGGTKKAGMINRNLAEAAEEWGVALGVGSQRKALEDQTQADSFRVRSVAKTAPLLANLGAIQLNYGYTVDHCQRAVDMIEADALVLHLNPLQECIQPEGQRNFSGLLPKIEEICRKLSVPVILKEVGNGISLPVARRLLEVGVRIIDVAGSGGTSFARIEGARAEGKSLGARFGDWGIPTPDAILALRELPNLVIIGSGGVRDGLDVAKSLALGADLVGAAYPFLRPAVESASAVSIEIRRVFEGLKITMLCTGSRTIQDLKRAPIRRKVDS
jgi:isopentenyl-diphosphate delta-isomerase